MRECVHCTAPEPSGPYGSQAHGGVYVCPECREEDGGGCVPWTLVVVVFVFYAITRVLSL
jgi:hypothetical protein